MDNNPRQLKISDYSYYLPAEKIAEYPLTERDSSRLLVYRKGHITDEVYSNIAEFLPGSSCLVFNDTRVINARLHFQKEGGSNIEIFCLEPVGEIASYYEALSVQSSATWKCLVGGASKWKDHELKLSGNNIVLKAERLQRLEESYIIKFSWTPHTMSFAEVLSVFGNIPLPPYIKRKPDAGDTERYQTTFAHHPGSVAAPTAGLHFTDHIFNQLYNKGIPRYNVTLHVGAGTFRPVKAEIMEGHEMHAEWIHTTPEILLRLSEQKEIFAVGTTSLRTLESLFWIGISLMEGKGIHPLDQWHAYDHAGVETTYAEAFRFLAAHLQKENRELFIQTRLLIAPGYRFRVAKGLITNFHQPGSTLLLLVAAAIGEKWKMVYDHALRHNYRFLSYGDGNLIFFDQG